MYSGLRKLGANIAGNSDILTIGNPIYRDQGPALGNAFITTTVPTSGLDLPGILNVGSPSPFEIDLAFDSMMQRELQRRALESRSMINDIRVNEFLNTQNKLGTLIDKLDSSGLI